MNAKHRTHTQTHIIFTFGWIVWNFGNWCWFVSKMKMCGRNRQQQTRRWPTLKIIRNVFFSLLVFSSLMRYISILFSIKLCNFVLNEFVLILFWEDRKNFNSIVFQPKEKKNSNTMRIFRFSMPFQSNL